MYPGSAVINESQFGPVGWPWAMVNGVVALPPHMWENRTRPTPLFPPSLPGFPGIRGFGVNKQTAGLLRLPPLWRRIESDRITLHQIKSNQIKSTCTNK